MEGILWRISKMICLAIMISCMQSIIDLSDGEHFNNNMTMEIHHPGNYFNPLPSLYMVQAQKELLHVQLQIRISTENSAGVRVLVGNGNLVAASSAIIAMQHFIERETLVVSNLDKIVEKNCPNMTVSYVLYDTISSPSYALESYLSSPRPDVIVGASRSAVSGPLAVCSGVQNVPQISYGSTSISLSDRSEYPQFARTIPSDAQVVHALASLFQTWKYRHIGILHTNDVYGSGYKQALFSECEKRGIRLFSSSYQYKSLSSLQTALRDLKSDSINVYVAVTFDEDLVPLAREASSLKMMGENNTLWFFSDGVSSFNILSQTDPVMRRILHGNLQILAAAGMPSDPGYTAYLNAWANGALDKYIPLINERLPGGKVYNQPGLGDLAEQNFTLSVSPAFFRANAPYTLARTVYDAVMAACISSCTANVSFPKPPNFKKPVHYQNLLKTSFQGASGFVAFDELGERKDGLIVLNSIQFDLHSSSSVSPPLSYINVGTFNTAWSINNFILFSSNTSIPPSDVNIPVIDQNSITISEVVIGYLYFSIIILTCVGLMIWTYIKRSTEVIKRSQWLFLEFFLFGNLLTAGAIPPLTIDQTPAANIACMCIVWFYSVGFVFTFASLFAKTYRVMRIFNNPKMQRFKITAVFLEKMIALIMLPDLVVLISWTLVDPLVWQVVVTGTDQYGFPTSSYGKCSSNSIGFPVAIFLYHLLVLMMGNVVAYKSRHAPSSFQESRWILVSLISTLQLFMVGIPALAAVYSMPIARFYLMATIIFINIMVIVGAIFVPKIKAVLKGEIADEYTEMNLRKSSSHGKKQSDLHNGDFGRKQSELIKSTPPMFSSGSANMNDDDRRSSKSASKENERKRKEPEGVILGDAIDAVKPVHLSSASFSLSIRGLNRESNNEKKMELDDRSIRDKTHQAQSASVSSKSDEKVEDFNDNEFDKSLSHMAGSDSKTDKETDITKSRDMHGNESKDNSTNAASYELTTT